MFISLPSGALGHTRNTDNIAFFEAYLPAGEYCAPRKPVTETFFFNYRDDDILGDGLDGDAGPLPAGRGHRPGFHLLQCRDGDLHHAGPWGLPLLRLLPRQAGRVLRLHLYQERRPGRRHLRSLWHSQHRAHSKRMVGQQKDLYFVRLFSFILYSFQLL